MQKEEILNHIDNIIKMTNDRAIGGLAQAKEFVRIYIGSESHFLKSLEKISQANSTNFIVSDTISILRGLRNYVENDLLRNISIQREIQIETVSDYLQQAENLLNDSKVHPAAAVVLIGASLEEFLRTWLEESEVDVSLINQNIDSYSKELKALGKITKQDIKDIISWAGNRNDAAHGHWENVKDKQRAKLMLEGINLFIRKYSS